MINTHIKWLFCILLLLGVSSCVLKRPSSYDGYFFDLKINGLPVIPIENKADKRSLANYVRYSSVRWQVADRAQGDLHFEITPNQYTQEKLGDLNEALEIAVVPLEKQQVATSSMLSKSQDVMINGAAAVSMKNYMLSNRLPEGAYVFRVKVRGSKTWDRKEVYVLFSS